MPAKFQQTITTNVEGRMVNYFEMDTINFRINITTYALDINDEMVPETVKTSGWIEMFADEAKTIPNVDPSDFAKFALAMPLVKTLIYWAISMIIRVILLVWRFTAVKPQRICWRFIGVQSVNTAFRRKC